MRQSPRFLLIGINGTYNYGCEAIVRGTELVIRTHWPNAELVYATPRPEDDERRLDGTDIELVPLHVLPRYHPKRVAHKIVSRGNIAWGPSIYPTRMLRDADVVLSIGGDIYTLSASGKCPGHLRSLVSFANAAQRHDAQYVLWGASVGPFDECPALERLIRGHLGRVDLITTREAATVEYLARLGVRDQVVACADPAFVVAPEIKRGNRHGRSLRVALNLSPLSLRYTGVDVQDAILSHARTVATMIERLDCRVLFVPHVICDFDAAADDRRYLARIYHTMPPSMQRHIDFLDGDVGFVATKRELAECDMLVAARMHCGVSGMSAGVPTILLAYSRKATGMALYVYDSEQWVFGLPQFGSPAFWHAVSEMVIAREGVCAWLKDRMAKVGDDVRSAVDALAQVVDHRTGRRSSSLFVRS